MSWISNLFKTQKTPSYQGATPYGSLLDATGGKEYYDKILARSQGGGGVGYSPDYVEKASNPVIARMRNQFNAYDLPELKSELTATGRRAGSPGFAQISKAYENQGLNEEAAYAPIYQQAEEARRADINAGINNLGAFNTGDYNAKNTQAGFAKDVYNQETKNIQADREANNARTGNVIQGAVALGGIPFTGGASLYPSLYDPYKSLVQSRTPVQPNYAYLDQPSGYNKPLTGRTAYGRI